MGRGSARARAATPAISVLKHLGVEFSVRSYEHDTQVRDFGEEAARSLGVDPAQIYKTLLVEVDAKLAVGIVPVSGMLNLKALAKTLGARKAQMADPTLAERKTGYVVGGMSPLGQKVKLPTVLDSSALDYDRILVSAGKRGLDLELAPDDLVRVTDATVAPIVRVTC